MRDLDVRNIDGTNYSTSPLPATKSLAVLTRLTKMVGETLLVIASRGAAALDDIDEDVIAFTVRQLVERLDEREVDQTVRDLLAGMRCAGVEKDVVQVFDAHFAGRLMHLFKVLQYSLEVNYSDFFDAVQSQSGDQLAGKDRTAA